MQTSGERPLTPSLSSRPAPYDGMKDPGRAPLKSSHSRFDRPSLLVPTARPAAAREAYRAYDSTRQSRTEPSRSRTALL